jgi:hypothetical protein
MDYLENILSDIANFSLVIFGFCATLYTVIYSFILNKKEALNELSELLKLGDKVALHSLKETSYTIYITRMRKFNLYIIICLWGSLGIYVLALIFKYFQLYKLSIKLTEELVVESFLVYILLMVTIILFIAIVVLISKSLKTYNKTTKI